MSQIKNNDIITGQSKAWLAHEEKKSLPTNFIATAQFLPVSWVVSVTRQVSDFQNL